MKLNLNLIKKWFDLIESETKTEEYRAITPYWLKRLFYNNNDNGIPLEEICQDLKDGNSFEFCRIKPKPFNSVFFKNGWKRKNGTPAPEMELQFQEIEIGKGKTEWGGSDELVFIIKLGKKIHEKSNQTTKRTSVKIQRCTIQSTD